MRIVAIVLKVYNVSMEEIIEKVIIGVVSALFGSGITIPVVIHFKNKKIVLKQNAGKGSSLIQAGRDVNGKQ